MMFIMNEETHSNFQPYIYNYTKNIDKQNTKYAAFTVILIKNKKCPVKNLDWSGYLYLNIIICFKHSNYIRNDMTIEKSLTGIMIKKPKIIKA